jgi:hypothetical protein
MFYTEGFIFKRMLAKCFPEGLLPGFPILPYVEVRLLVQFYQLF